MRVDWEGEIKDYWVQAQYHMDYSAVGDKNIVVVDKFLVFNKIEEDITDIGVLQPIDIELHIEQELI